MADYKGLEVFDPAPTGSGGTFLDGNIRTIADRLTDLEEGGVDGADGKTILSGAGAPADVLGTDGDFYLDTAASDLYGPKAAGAWGAGVSLIGPQGEQGIQGNPGADGEDGSDGANGTNGADGADGADGKTILNGAGAPADLIGTDGDFYIDTAADAIYGPKAAGAWGAGVSLIGPQGEQGIQGDPGADGADGANGTNGTNGADGADGADGRTILSGAGAPAGVLGTDGDFYIDTGASDLYGPKAAGVWGAGVSLIGPQGDQGIQGDPGADGADGSDGDPTTGVSGGRTFVGGTDAGDDLGLQSTSHGTPGKVTSLDPLECQKSATFAAEVDNGNSGAAKTIDLGAGNKQKLTLTGNATLTLTAPIGPGNFLLKLVQDGTGSRTVTWPASVRWPAATAPTLSTVAASIDIVSLYFDGTNYYGQAGIGFA